MDFKTLRCTIGQVRLGFLWIILVGMFLVFQNPGEVYGQSGNEGLIFKSASGEGRSVLDPNGTGNVFDQGVPFRAMPMIDFEPVDDVRTGPRGGHTDLVTLQSGETHVGDGAGSAFMYYDEARDALLFRVFLAGQSNASKGYSFLFNTDVTLGSSPHLEGATPSNPGDYSFEVVLETNHRVAIYALDEDGVIDDPSNPRILDLDTHFQKAVAKPFDIDGTGSLSSDPGYFYDFWVPISEIDDHLNGNSFQANTPFCAVVGTITSARSGFHGTISDIMGVDDSNYRSRNNAQVRVLDACSAVSPDQINSGFGDAVTSVPAIDSPVTEEDTEVSGSSIEAEGTSITLYRNGSSAGSANVASDKTWVVTGLNLDAGDQLTASADATGKLSSDPDDSTPVIVRSISDVCTERPFNLENSGNTFLGTVPNLPAGATEDSLTIRFYQNDQLVISTSSEDKNADETINLVEYEFFSQDGSTGNVDFELDSGEEGNAYNNEDFFITAEYEGQCESDFGFLADDDEDLVQAEAPEITTSTIDPTSTTSVEGISDETDGATIFLYVNDDENVIGSTTVSGGQWLISGINTNDLQDGDEVYARVEVSDVAGEDDRVLSSRSNTVIVGASRTLPPVITGEYRADSEVRIEGYTDEGGSTQIKVFLNGVEAGETISDAYGNWDLEGVDLSGHAGDKLSATATASGKSTSELSEPVTILAGETNPPVIEGGTDSQTVDDFGGDISISGGGDTNRIYVDGELAVQTSSSTVGFTTSTVNGGGETLGDLIEPGVEVFATAQNSNEIESTSSNTVSVLAGQVRYITLKSINPDPASGGGGVDVAIIYRVLDGNFNVESEVPLSFEIENGEGSRTPSSESTNIDGEALVSYTTDPQDDGEFVQVSASDDQGIADPATGSFEVEKLAFPLISNVSLGKDGSNNLDFSFDVDRQLGSSASDISVSVDGPATNDVYTFDRNDFSESVSGGTYTYSLTAVQAYDDGEGVYTATIDNAIDTAGQNGADGSHSDTFDFSEPGSDPAQLTIKSGDGQTGTVAEPLADALVVEVIDEQENPLAGVEVSFTITTTPDGAEDQELVNVEATTDTEGLASAELILGTRTGDYQVTAGVNELDDAIFTANAEAGSISSSESSVTATSPHISDGTDASEVTIQLRDNHGNVISGIPEQLFNFNFGASDAEVKSGSFAEENGVYTIEVINSTSESTTVTVNADGVSLDDSPQISFEQSMVTLSGTVYNGVTGEVLDGAAITIAGETWTSESESDGSYDIELPDNETFTISAVIEVDGIEIVDSAEVEMDGSQTEDLELWPVLSGEGSEEDPYQISHPYELQSVIQNLSAHYLLMNDLDLSDSSVWNNGDGFRPLGDDDTRFTGNFHGQGFAVSGLTIDREGESDVGLFGVIDDGSLIEDLHLRDLNVTAQRRVGGVAGVNNGEIINISVTGTVKGIQTSDSSVQAGGLAGSNNGLIERSFTDTAVWGNEERIGGVAGQNSSSGVIRYSYSVGTTTNDPRRWLIRTGGLAGHNNGLIESSFAAGPVTNEGSSGDNRIGGLVGRDGNGTVTDSYWDMEATGQSSDQDGSSIGLTTDQMSGYSAFFGMSEFNFEMFFEPVESGYPELRTNRQTGNNIAGVDAENSVVEATSPHIIKSSDPSEVTIQVLDTGGDPVIGMREADFAITLGGSAEIVDAVEESGQEGKYLFTVGNTVSETISVSVEAANVGLNDQPEIVFGVGDPDHLVIIDFDPASISAGDAFDVLIEVRDANGNPISNAEQDNFVITSEHDGEVHSVTQAVFDGDGHFTAEIDAGEVTTSDDEHEFTVVADGVGSTTFDLEVLAGIPSQIILSEVDSPQVAVEPFDITFTVEDQYGNRAVDFDGTLELSVEFGGIGPDQVEFDPADEGQKTVSLTLDESGDGQKITAEWTFDSDVNGESNEFEVAAGAPVADNSSADVPDGQAGEVTEITVTLLDENDNPVPGAGGDLDLSVSEGPNEGAEFTDIVDNGDGSYTVSYTPEIAGNDEIVITLNGDQIDDSPYTSTVAAGDPDQIVEVGQPAETMAGQVIEGPPSVRVADAFNNPISDIEVTVSLLRLTGSQNSEAQESESNSLGAEALSDEVAEFEDGTLTVRTDQDGLAEYDDLVIIQLGTYKLQFSADEVGDEAESEEFDVAAGVPVVENSTAEVPDGQVGEETEITITLRDEFGNPVPGAGDELELSLEGANEGAEFTEFVDNGDGSYTVSYTPMIAGDDEVNIALGDVPIDGSPFTSEVAPAPPSELVIVSGNNQEQSTRSWLEEPLVVRLEDQFGNAVAGEMVYFEFGDVPEGAEAHELSVYELLTDEMGEAFVEMRLGSSSGLYQIEVRAENGEVDPAVFSQEAEEADIDPDFHDIVNTVVFNGGLSAYMYAEYDESLDQTEGSNLEIWVLPSSLNSDGAIAGRWDDNNEDNQQFRLRVIGNELILELVDDEGHRYEIEIPDFFSFTEVAGDEEAASMARAMIRAGDQVFDEVPELLFNWTHISLVVDPDNERIQLYRDGFELRREQLLSNLQSSDAPLEVGRGFDGEIHEVRLWDQPRSRSEIQAQKDLILTGSEDNLVLYHTFDEEEGDHVAVDASGNNNNFLLAEDVDRNRSLRNVTRVTLHQDEDFIVRLTALDSNESNLQAYVTELPSHGALYQLDGDLEPAEKITEANTRITEQYSRSFYKPENDFVGVDSIRYRIEDEHGNFVEEILEFEVLQVNRPPVISELGLLKLIPQDTLAIELDTLVTDNIYESEEITWDIQLLDQQSSDTQRLSINLDQENRKLYLLSSSILDSDEVRLRLSATDPEGLSGYRNFEITVEGDPVTDYKLFQNYPNPFNHETNIEFQVPVSAEVVISLYDALGRRVKVLVEGQFDQGIHINDWSPKGLSSGIYYYRMQATGADGSRHMEAIPLTYIR